MAANKQLRRTQINDKLDTKNNKSERLLSIENLKTVNSDLLLFNQLKAIYSCCGIVRLSF